MLERERDLKNVPKKFYVRVWIVPGICHVYVVLICLEGVGGDVEVLVNVQSLLSFSCQRLRTPGAQPPISYTPVMNE